MTGDGSGRFRWSAVWRSIVSAMSAAAGPTLPVCAGSLAVCTKCHRDRVFPLDWEPTGGGRWTVELYCGECGAQRTRIATIGEAAAFETTLDRHRRAIERAAQRLGAGLVEPTDFGR